jgi:hypothetical protein
MKTSAGREGESSCNVVQIGLTSSDLSGTLRLYAELFGFANAHGVPIWGNPLAVQGLAASARGIMWWLVGRQSFFQLEVFQYSVPVSRTQPVDWRPADHGWVRFGVAVSDFRGVLAQLSKWGIAPLGQTKEVDGLRRLAFRDPFVGAIVEILEDGTGVPGGIREKSNNVDPAIVYVTSSVSNLGAARKFYGETLRLPIESRDVLHRAEHETMWGLADSVSEGFVARAGDIFIEVVQYQQPEGRPKPPGWSVTDQGIMNIAIGSRNKRLILDLLGRVQKVGVRTGPVMSFGESMGVYLLEKERELELVSLPESQDEEWGFKASKPFLGLG